MQRRRLQVLPTVVSMIGLGAVVVATVHAGAAQAALGPRPANPDGPATFTLFQQAEAVNSIIFALACADKVVPVLYDYNGAYTDAVTPAGTRQAFRGVLGGAAVIGGLMCWVVGLAGYTAWGEETEADVLENLDSDPLRLLLLVHLALYFPVDLMVCEPGSETAD